MEAEDTVDETNDDDSDYEIDDNDEDDDASSVGSTESLVPLQDVIDTVTGQRETEDSDFHLGELFNVNIGDGGFVEIIELKDMGEERSLHLWGFSHRWTKLDPSDRRRTIILLRDAIDWLVLNVFLLYLSLLPDESRGNVSLHSSVDNDNEEEIQRLWFVTNYIVVCGLFNRIIRCVPWCYIEPFDLLKKSAMPKDMLHIIYLIRLWLIDRACKNRCVKKECFTDVDSENTIPVWVIPLLYI